MSRNLFKARKLFIPVDIDRQDNFIADDDLELMIGAVENQKLSYVIHGFEFFLFYVVFKFILTRIKIFKKGSYFKTIC